MNYGKKGIIQKKRMLNSSTTKIGSKFGVAGVKLLFIAIITVIVAGSCLALGAAQGIIASAPDIESIDVSPEGYATRVYDCNGNETQALATSGSNRISVDIENVPLDLQHAFIAIEDERFYEHNGIDIKGIIRAGSQLFTSGSLSQGASTITQQLLKNNVFKAYNETQIEKIKRKVQEQYLAVKLETVMDKQTILENYLNTINLGNGYYGVQSAAKGYFGKDVSDLSLSECAVIASITQSPNNLNPARHPEDNQKRQRRVLQNMLDQGYITQDEYSEAIEDDVYARIQSNDVEVAGAASTYSYFVDTVIEEVINDLQEQKGYTESQAENLIYKGGLSIYTTQDMDMQSIADSVINDPSYYPSTVEYSINYNISIKNTDGSVSSYSHYGLLEYFSQTDPSFTLTFKNQDTAQTYVDRYREHLLADGGTVLTENLTYTMQPQMSFTLIEQSTGYVKVIVGGRGEKTSNRSLNRATSSTRQPGSSIKPLVAYGPAFDLGVLSLASPLDDAPYYYTGEDARLVKNYNAGQYRGIVSVREALFRSLNVPAVKVLTSITPQVGYNYLSKMGISTLVSPKNAINGNHDVVQSLALGGMTLGVYNIDMTSAYSSIANGGVRVTPVYYTQVLDRDGNVILDNTEKETTTVMKETTAWLLTEGLRGVVENAAGTGRATKLSSQPVAGKTGTTQYDYDKWFCGFTPYYTASIWLGYDDNSKALPTSIDHTKMWKVIMEQIHEGLETKEFTKPEEGIEEVEVCAQSGKLPVEGLCDQDPRGSQLVTDYFATDAVPTETCDIHVKVTICNDTGMVARTGCKNTTTKIMVKKSAVNIPAEVEDPTEYTTWDEAYSITQEELNTPCTSHSGASTYSSSSSGSATTNGNSSSGITNGTTKSNSNSTTTTAPTASLPTPTAKAASGNSSNRRSN